MKTLLLILAFSFAAFGQDDLPILGKVSDLNGKNKVYITTESSQDRKFILMALKKKKSTLEVVADPKNADFFLEFKTLSRQDKKALFGSQYTEDGEMTVYFYGADKRKIVAWSETKQFYQAGGLSVEAPNSYVLTRRFVNALNGKKE